MTARRAARGTGVAGGWVSCAATGSADGVGLAGRPTIRFVDSAGAQADNIKMGIKNRVG